MPLKKGKGSFGKNYKKLIAEGKSRKQSIAISLALQRRQS